MPGPGEYMNSTDTFGKGKAFTFGGKRNNNKVNDNPGPGSYS